MIFTITSIPGSELPQHDLELPDKLIHFVIYLPLGTLTLRAVCPDRVTARLLFRSLLYTVLFAAVDETHQALIPEREVEILDLIADICGLMTGHVFFLLIKAKRA